MAMILTGRHMSAKEMFDLRLVQELVPHDKIVSRALEWAEQITANSPDGVRASKAQARHGREVGWIQANLDTNILPESVAMREGKNFIEGPKVCSYSSLLSSLPLIFLALFSRHSPKSASPTGRLPTPSRSPSSKRQLRSHFGRWDGFKCMVHVNRTR